MAAGDVAVAQSNDTLSRKASAPSRRSIISRIGSKGGELQSPVSNTDAVLRSRTASTSDSGSVNKRGSKSNGSIKKQGSINSNEKSPSLGVSNGDAPNYLSAPNGDSNGGLTPPRKDSDNRSNASRRSARNVISGIISRTRSRQSSVEPENETNNSTRRTSFSNGAARRMSVRMPGLNRKTSANSNRFATRESNDFQTEKDEKDQLPPPVPAVPEQHSRPSVLSNGDGRTASSGLIRDSSIPKHPHQKGEQNGHTEEEGEESSKGVLGGAVAAITGAGAAAGGAAAAIASKVTGNGQHREEDEDDYSSQDEFHDADLGDIEEHDEEEDQSTEHHQIQQQSRPSASQREASHQSNSSRHRHRGLSEGEGMALGGAGAGAALATANHNKSKDSSYGAKRSSSPDQTLSSNRASSIKSNSSRAPSQLRGTSGAKRRSGSVPSGNDTQTPTDAKARNETPFYVREKSARVRKLTYDDVVMTEEEMFADIKEARKALNLFLNSRMLEAEEMIAKYADQKLYYALGDALIAVIKGFMTFEPEDLAKAISYCKDALHMATLLRKQTNTVSNFGRFVRGTGHGPSTMANMSIVQRHAELIYAESLLLKAVMGILYSGDFFGFVAEALNMRNAYGIYRSLSKYVEWADERASGARDQTIDEDFRSGVYLGNGLISMILGLLPGKVLKIMEVFGYTGDTKWALKTLARAGEWTQKSDKPGMPVENEGIRRQVCDMGILLYHLVISTFIPVTGVDIDFADKVLHYNLERYPQGVFFLYFSGRLYSTQSLAEKAITQFKAARDVQKEYVQLQHICVWDMSLCHMSLTQFEQAYKCFTTLLKDSNWSKCVYSYGQAANLYASASDPKDERRQEAGKIFSIVPEKMQRIAGKSIPMEKFCARKAKKFNKQQRLLLPGLEFSYIYHCFTNAPSYSLCDNQLVDISEALQEINQVQDPSEYYSGADEYWDDYCLAHFLRGVTLRYIAYPEKHAKLNESENPIPQNEAAEQAEISLRNVIESSHRLSLDHYLCYFAHYELGRLYASQGNKSEAREHYDMIMSGKTLEASTKGKGKYSMQNMCTLRTNGALSVL
ncbi:hypothetical protein L7F22_018993 [Adiantum nelumboides]|nr:hypothetical protein [Adiantum nelumboides]